MRRKTLCGFVVAAVLSIGLASVGSAATVIWEFEGRAEYMWTRDGTPEGLAALGVTLASLGVQQYAPVSGRFVIETSAPDLWPEVELALYDGAVVHSDLLVGSYALSKDAFHGYPGYKGGHIVAHVGQQSGFSVLSLTSFLGDEIGLVSQFGEMRLDLASMNSNFFRDATRSPPLDPPALSEIEPFTPGGYGTHLFFGIVTELGSFDLYASVSRLERVPEPGVFALVAPGLLALVALRRRAS